MDEKDPQKLADELEGEASELEDKLESLDHEISEVREDWLRKRNDSDVPGAVPQADDAGDGHEAAPAGD
jgi:hypothetical protein